MSNTQQQIHLSDEERAAMVEYKRIKDAMRSDIKELNMQQLVAKQQTKLYSDLALQSKSQQAAHLNGVELRHMYLAYAIFRNPARPPRLHDIPEQDYMYNVEKGRIVRRDGKAITRQENAPNNDYLNTILDKYGIRSKTVHLGS